MATERTVTKPTRPDGCPLTPHPKGQWCKKIDGRVRYFGPWNDLDGALARYQAFLLTGSLPPKTKEKKRDRTPPKPVGTFPLFLHSNGQYAKKIRGRTHYFGSDPQAAWDRYLAEAQALHAGKRPPSRNRVTVHEVVNRFLKAKEKAAETGEIVVRTFDDYAAACGLFLQQVDGTMPVDDLRPENWSRLREYIVGRFGPSRASKTIGAIRSAMLFASEFELLEKPVRYGGQFKKPTAKTFRIHRQQTPLRFSDRDIRRLLDAAHEPLRTMILLAMNCGFNNADCGTLPVSALNLDDGWHVYPRPKTGAERKAKLWPETIEGLRRVLKRSRDGLVFITKQGNPFTSHDRRRDTAICHEFAKARKLAGIGGPGFVGLRRTFAAIAGDYGDQLAANYIMGHAPAQKDMPAQYRGAALDRKLTAIAGYVHQWLYPRPSTTGEA